MLDLLDEGNLTLLLKILDQHIDRTKTTYSSEIEDIAAADGKV